MVKLGKFDFNIDDEITRQIMRLENIDEIAPKILNETVPILETNIKKECAKHRRTGELESSVKKSSSRKVKDGYIVVVRPTGKSKLYKTVKGATGTRKEPVRNMEIMAHVEYGTKDIKPIPVMTKGLKESEQPVKERMQQLYNEYVGGGSN